MLDLLVCYVVLSLTWCIKMKRWVVLNFLYHVIVVVVVVIIVVIVIVIVVVEVSYCYCYCLS